MDLVSRTCVLIQGDEFVYNDLWSSRVTWAGEPPPFEGESVIIPAGQHILYDLPSSPQLALILVEGEFLRIPRFRLATGRRLQCT